MGQAVPLLIMAAATGAQVHNQNQALKRQDQQAAQGIQRQGRLQRQADERVNQQITDLEGSTAAESRAARQAQYMDTLRRNRASIEAGLTPGVGSQAFQDDSARAVEGVQGYAADSAGLMARMDAPGMQRQGESFGFGRAATDLGLIGRESRGDAFINELRMRAIRPNPWVDAASQVAMGYASGMGGAGSSGSGITYNDYGAFNPSGGVALSNNSMMTQRPYLSGGRNSLIYGNYGGLGG